jgi:hypothetical protein
LETGNAVTDAGPEVKKCCNTLLPNPWIWCKSHEASTALGATFEAPDRAENHVNMAPVKALLKKIRSIVEYFHKSSIGATILGEILAATVQDHGLHSFSKLAQAIHQRWGSLVKCLISFIERYDALKEAYHIREKDWELTFDDYRSVIELISMLSPVRDIIVVAQSNEGAQLPFVVMMLAKLRMEVLNPSRPLTILDPTHINKEKKMKNIPPTVPPAPPLPPIPPRDNFDLTDLGQATRLGLADAMSKGNRYFHLNSRLGSCKPDKGLGGTDIVTFFHPFLRKLKHIDAINSETPGYDPAVDAAWIEPYKERVKQYILQQMTEVILHNDSRLVLPPVIHVVDEPQLNVAKRQRVPEPQGDILALNKKRILAMKQASYMDIDDEVGSAMESTRTSAHALDFSVSISWTSRTSNLLPSVK